MPLVILLFALFASLFTLQKDTLKFAEPFFLVGSRMTFAGLMLLSFQYLRAPKSFHLTKAMIRPLVFLGLFNIYLTNVCEAWGVNNMESSKACLIYSLSPFLAALIAFIVLKEKLSHKKWLGMMIGFLGLIPIFYLQTQAEIAAGTFFVFTKAELTILGAASFSVYGWILLKQLVDKFNTPPILANGLSMTLGGLLALGHSYLSNETWAPIPVSDLKSFLINSLTLCLISNVICYNLYGYLLKRFSATFMSFSGLVTPFFAALFGWYFLDETINLAFYISMVLFFVGLTIFYLEELKQNRHQKREKTKLQDLVPGPQIS